VGFASGNGTNTGKPNNLHGPYFYLAIRAYILALSINIVTVIATESPLMPPVGRIFDKETYVARLAPFVKQLRGRIPVAYTLITPLPLRLQSGWNLYSKMRRFGVDDPSMLAGFMAKGSPDRDVPAELVPEGDDIVFEKSTQNLFVRTNVEMILRNREVKTLVFTGIATEIGVETSARDAGARGFYPVIVSDGVSSMDREGHERSLKALAKLGIVATMAEVSAAIAASGVAAH